MCGARCDMHAKKWSNHTGGENRCTHLMLCSYGMDLTMAECPVRHYAHLWWKLLLIERTMVGCATTLPRCSAETFIPLHLWTSDAFGFGVLNTIVVIIFEPVSTIPCSIFYARLVSEDNWEGESVKFVGSWKSKICAQRGRDGDGDAW